MNRLTIATIVWAALLVAHFVFPPMLAETLWGAHLPIHYGLPLAGVVILCWAGRPSREKG